MDHDPDVWAMVPRDPTHADVDAAAELLARLGHQEWHSLDRMMQDRLRTKARAIIAAFLARYPA
ncbi:MAG TPA: hypothetical protein VL574_04600 [Stellaceae bacterium]|jgi:hypothetical protein|nr:hypothetical protein [Stellaceae bacterium]